MGVPDDRYERVISAVRAGIEAGDGHLDTGILGTRFFFEVLAEHGLNELAYEAMNKRSKPGFGRWIELGSTTTRERWDEDGSHNHPMFGGGLVWFYRNLAGMQADPEQPGYRHIIFRPQPVEQLDFVTYTTETPYGTGGITWKNEEDAFTLEVTVPVGCTATVYLPASTPQQVPESTRAAEHDPWVEFKGMEKGQAVLNVQSGRYSFRVVN